MNCTPINKDKMKKALKWLAENIQNNPEKSRTAILREAEIRYDLSPRECTFLDDHFADPQTKGCH